MNNIQQRPRAPTSVHSSDKNSVYCVSCLILPFTLLCIVYHLTIQCIAYHLTIQCIVYHLTWLITFWAASFSCFRSRISLFSLSSFFLASFSVFWSWFSSNLQKTIQKSVNITLIANQKYLPTSSIKTTILHLKYNY